MSWLLLVALPSVLTVLGLVLQTMLVIMRLSFSWGRPGLGVLWILEGTHRPTLTYILDLGATALRPGRHCGNLSGLVGRAWSCRQIKANVN